jgi:GTP-binding protein Era
MVVSDPTEGHRSGFVGLIGRPNVGKSSLLNAFLKQSIAPVSSQPQTTRIRQLGILTLHTAQIIFVDTPGLHKPHHKLGDWMNANAEGILKDCDVLLILFDASLSPQEDDMRVVESIQSLGDVPQVLVILNKIDRLDERTLPERVKEFQTLLPEAEAILISATRGDQLQALLECIIEALPVGPRYYPEEQITDATEREITADLIRSAALELLHDEVPHCIAVVVEDFQERGEEGAYIKATIFVERNSQKGIVIGKGGSMIRQIGASARNEIERMSGRKVYLELRVKVLKGWRNDLATLRRLGYDKKGSSR